MFDPTTAALIRAAPPLEGLDLDNLPKRLTEAFADIVSARIRLRGAPADAEDEALAATVTELRRIADLFGKNLDKQLIPVEASTSLVELRGFVGLPEYARRRNPLQYLTVNGRNMRQKKKKDNTAPKSGRGRR